MTHNIESNTAINLDSYLKRIGYEGPLPLKPSHEVLAALQLRHSQAIPFENLNPILGLPVRLDATTLTEKILEQARGGYCYEQNGLLKRVLEQIGFQVEGFAAKVIWKATTDNLMRSHKVLRVTCKDGTFLVDAGFGLVVPTAPIPMMPDTVTQTPHERFQLLPIGQDELKLQVEFNGTWHDLYQFDEQIQQPADYDVYNWYVSTHPDSMFVNNLIVSKPFDNGRLTLRNNQLATRYLDGSNKTRILTTGPEIRDVLVDAFHLDLSKLVGIDQLLEKIASESAPDAN